MKRPPGTSPPAPGGSGSDPGWRARRSAPRRPREAPLGRGGRVPRGGLLPLRLGGQPAAGPAGVGVGLEPADVLHRLVVGQRLDAAEPATQPGPALAEPERRRPLAGLAAPPPAGRGPQPLVVVAAGLDERAVGGVGDRHRVDEVRRHVDLVRGPLVVQRPRVGGRAHRERAARDQHLGGADQRRGRRQGVGRREDRVSATQLVGGQHRLVVLVLVLEDHAEHEARVEQRPGRVEPDRVEGVQHLAPDQADVVPGLRRVEQRQRRPGRRGGARRRRRCRRARAASPRCRPPRAAATAPRSCRCARGPTPAATSAASAGRAARTRRGHRWSGRRCGRGCARARRRRTA